MLVLKLVPQTDITSPSPFAHGSNDVANAIGPLAAVVSIIHNDGEITSKAGLVWWILPLGGLGIVAGLALFGHRVIATIGNGITHLTPSRGFAAELAAACTVVIASGTGFFVLKGIFAP